MPIIRFLKLRRYEKNTVKAFVDLELSRGGLVFRDCTWHEKNGQEWISLPARSYEGDDGATRWQPLIEFTVGAKQAREQYQRHAIAAIHIFIEQESWAGIMTSRPPIVSPPAPEPLAAAQARMPTWRVMVHVCLAARAPLNSKECEFLRSLLTWRGPPRPKQMAWLTRS
jgi:hypothetical protein